IRPALLVGHSNSFFVRGKDGLKTSLVGGVVPQHHRSDVKRLAASLARGGLALHVLHEAVGEVVFRTLPPGRFHSLTAAMWTYKLDQIFLRVPIQSGPTRVSNSYDVFRMRIAVHGQKTSNMSWTTKL